MKIYYAAAMLGDRSNFHNNKIIINELKKYGFTILTEFILGDIEVDVPPVEIYRRDINLLRESDILIADISYPSLGVGFEIAYALNLNKKVIALCRKDRIENTSRLILGIDDKNFQIIMYENPFKAVKKILDLVF